MAKKITVLAEIRAADYHQKNVVEPAERVVGINTEAIDSSSMTTNKIVKKSLKKKKKC